MYVYMYVMYVCMYVCMYVRMCIYTYVCMHACMNMQCCICNMYLHMPALYLSCKNLVEGHTYLVYNNQNLAFIIGVLFLFTIYMS